MSMNWKLLLFLFLAGLSKSRGTQPHAENHRYNLHNFTVGANFINDLTVQKAVEHPQYEQPPQEYLDNYEHLLTRSSNVSPDSVHRNPNFMDIESHQKILASQSVPNVRIYRINPFINNDNLMYYHQHNDHESDFQNPLKKHDFVRGQQNFDGWDSFQSGHNMGMGNFGGFGLAQAAGALKKGKEAKALFVLMAPLILLAVFGPILATQAMIPWVANGGLTSVTTVAGSGKRRKRQSDPRHGGEMEKRLQLFMEVQDFIARTGSQDLVEEMGEAFLRCQKYTERRNKCLERVACAYTDNVSVIDPEERRIGKMVLRNVMSNPLVPSSLIGKLKKGFIFGKKRPGQCANFWCEVVDNPKTKMKY